MELQEGMVAVVTGAASGIGLAMSERFASSGMNVVLADVDERRLDVAVARVEGKGVAALGVATDVSDEKQVAVLADAAFDRFGAVHVVCNNAGVAPMTDAWFGPLSAWEWVMGVNFWGVLHGVRTFFPRLIEQGSGHIVNTASVAGLHPGLHAAYDASKHAVVAMTEDLYRAVTAAQLPVGVSVLCPGWVRTSIAEPDRYWPDRLGERPPDSLEAGVVLPHLRRAIAEGTPPAAVADLVADAVQEGRYWVFTDERFTKICLERWHSVAEQRNPDLERDTPGMPTAKEIMAEVQAALGG